MDPAKYVLKIEWNLRLTSLDMGGQTPPPLFQNSSKNYFTSIPSDQGPGTENPRSLGI